jgi:hypothetical protein
MMPAMRAWLGNPQERIRRQDIALGELLHGSHRAHIGID